MLTPEQLAERRTGIGGSDAAIVLNIHPFREPLWLYHEKRGSLPVADPDEETPTNLHWGSLLEQPICDYFSGYTGKKLIRQNQLIRSKKYPFMVAHVDRRVVGMEDGRRIGMEAKSDAWGHGWGPSGSSEIPPYIMVQCQHYLVVTEWDEWDLAVLIGNRDFRTYKIFPIMEIIEPMIAAEEVFWDRVQAGVPPEANYEHKSTIELVKRLYPGTNGSVVRLPDVAQELADTIDKANEAIKVEKQVVDGCKARIAMMLGEASAGLLPDGTCFTRKEIQRAGYSVDATSFMQLSRVKKLPKLVEQALQNNTIIENTMVATKEITDGA